MTLEAQLPDTSVEESPTIGRATWISTPERSLLAWYHRPESGEAKGVVVIAPPIGREQVISYRTMRILAIMLAEQGWAAVRFSWSHTGESEDLPAGATWSTEWLKDLETVRTWAANTTGFSDVNAIGLRIGASLLGDPRVTGFAQRIAWEPIAGKKFLRQHAALRRLSVPEIPRWDATSEEVIGALLTPENVADLERIVSPEPSESDTDGKLIVDKEPDPKVAKGVYAVVSLYARVPPESLQRLIDLLPDAPPQPLPQWQPADRARIWVPGFDTDVIEEIVSVGPDHLPAIFTYPLSGARTSEATLMFAASSEPRDGITGLWVRAARRLAANGIAVVRSERRGSGDLGRRHDLVDPNPFSASAIADAQNTARWLKEATGARITGTGLCAGAWLCGAAAAEAPIERVLMLNNVAWRTGLGYFEDLYRDLNPENVLKDIREGEKGEAPRTFKSKVKELVRNRGGYRLWLALGSLDKVNAPERVLELASRHATLDVYLGEDDFKLFTFEKGLPGLKRLQRAGRPVTVHRSDPMDHALLAPASRLRALRVIEEYFGIDTPDIDSAVVQETTKVTV